MPKLIKYIGADEYLGEVAAETKYYYLVHIYRDKDGSRTKKTIDPRLVSIPKWCTQITTMEDLTT